MHTFTLLAISLVVLIAPNCVLSYSFKGNKITDLDGDGSDFISDSALWRVYVYNETYSHTATYNDTSTQKYFACGTKYLMGVEHRETVISKVYEDLPPHNMIYFSIKLSLIDKWMFNGSFAILFDQQSQAVGLTANDYQNFSENICGDSGTNDLEFTLSGKAKHIGDTLRLSVSTFAPGNAFIRSFGFREVTLLFRNSSKDEHQKGFEALEYCGHTSIDLLPPQCNCSEGQYQSHVDGTCQPCHPLCKTCLGPSPSQCLNCKDTAFFDGAECSTCHPSCATCSGSSADQCLSCPNNYYLFEGKSCIESCNAPFISTLAGTVKHCSQPCPADEFLYSNGTCSSICDSNHNSITWNGVKLCSDYCPLGKYYAPPQGSSTGGCLDSCSEGRYIESTSGYCLSCQDPLCRSCSADNGATCQQCKEGFILDTDGVCKECTSLNVMYFKALDIGHQYKLQMLPQLCNLNAFTLQQDLTATLTQSDQGFPPYTFHVTPYTSTNTPNTYLVDLVLEGSVLETSDINLELHHLSGLMIVPKTFVPSLELQGVAEYAPVAETLITTTIAVSFVGAVTLGSTAAIWSIISFQQFVCYFAFINVAFPFQVQTFFSLLGSSTWDFLPNPLESLTKPLYDSLIRSGEFSDPDNQPPQKFIENDMTSAFIENGGGILLVNVFLICLLLLVGLIKKKVYGMKKNRILRAVKSALRWNVIARTYLENCIPLLLAIFLQLRSLSFDHIYLTLGSLFSFLALIYCIVILRFLTRILKSSTVTELKKDPSKNKYGTLWAGIALETPASKYYHVIILLRGAVLAFLVVFFEETPVVQILPLIIVNATFVYYLFKEIKFEDRNLNLINRAKEILILIGEVFILGLVFQGGSEEYYSTLGWLIVSCFVSALLVELGYTVWLQIKGLKEIKKKVVALWNFIHNWFTNKEARQRQRVRKDRTRRVSPLKYDDIPAGDKSDMNSSYVDKSFN